MSNFSDNDMNSDDNYHEFQDFDSADSDALSARAFMAKGRDNIQNNKGSEISSHFFASVKEN